MRPFSLKLVTLSPATTFNIAALSFEIYPRAANCESPEVARKYIRTVLGTSEPATFILSVGRQPFRVWFNPNPSEKAEVHLPLLRAKIVVRGDCLIEVPCTDQWFNVKALHDCSLQRLVDYRYEEYDPASPCVEECCQPQMKPQEPRRCVRKCRLYDPCMLAYESMNDYVDMYEPM